MDTWVKKWVLSTTLFFFVATTVAVPAEEYCINTGGCAYQESCRSCCITPAVSLAAVLLAAIIAVGFHNNKGSDGHNHAHCE